MTECINNAQFNQTLQNSSKVIFDGTNNSQVQGGQTLNVFIANVVNAILALQNALAALDIEAEDVGVGGITSSIVDPTGLDLGEWLTNLSTYIANFQSAVAAMDAGDVPYSADYQDISGGVVTTVEEALGALHAYVSEYQKTEEYITLQKVQMPFYPFYIGSLTITDVTTTTPKVEIAYAEYWLRNGYANKEAETLDLEDDKDNYIFVPGYLNLSSVIASVKYGYLYNGYAVNDARGITSGAGWRVPLYADFDTLRTYATPTTGGGKLKEKSLNHWDLPNTGATNEYSFNGRGGGRLDTDGTFKNIKKFGTLWGSIDNPNLNFILDLDKDSAVINPITNLVTRTGLSFRPVRDASVLEQTYADGTPCTPYTGNDGQIYPTVKIGTQVWTACNLAETKYANGDLIPNVTDSALFPKLTTGARCAYDNLKSNVYNFTFLDDTQLNYNVQSVAIGGTAPTSNDILIAKIPVSGGVVGTPVVAIGQYPVKNDQLADSSVKGRNISMADTFDAGFSQDGDTKIISHAVQNSIELSGGKPQLKNDSATPGNYKYYGTNAVGTKGFFDFPYYSDGSANFFQFADGSKGFQDVDDAYGQARYNGNGAYTFGVRAEAAGDNSFVFGTADASKGEFATGSNNTGQSSHFELTCETTDATPTYMTIDGQWISFRQDTFSRVKIEMSAVDFNNTLGSCFDDYIVGVFNDGGTLTFTGNPPSRQQENPDNSNITGIVYDVEIVSNVMYIKVFGLAATTLRWTAKVSKVEINNKANLS